MKNQLQRQKIRTVLPALDRSIFVLLVWLEISVERLSAGFNVRRAAFALLLTFFALLRQPLELRAESSGPAPLHIASVLEDEEDNKLSFPFFVHSEHALNEIYIIDSKSRILIYTENLYPLFTLDSGYGIEAPLSVTTDSDGNLYVVQAPTKNIQRGRITVLSASLALDRDIYPMDASGGIIEPARIAIDTKGRIHATLSDASGVAVLDRDGRLLEMLGQEEDGKKVLITNLTIDSAGRLYLLSEGMSRIYVYDNAGKFMFKFGQKGGTTGTLSRPQAIAVDTDRENIYVVDYMRHTVNIYDMNGKFLSEFGGMGWGPGWFQFPRDIAVDRTGRLVVADMFNHRFQVFQPVNLGKSLE